MEQLALQTRIFFYNYLKSSPELLQQVFFFSFWYWKLGGKVKNIINIIIKILCMFSYISLGKADHFLWAQFLLNKLKGCISFTPYPRKVWRSLMTAIEPPFTQHWSWHLNQRKPFSSELDQFSIRINFAFPLQCLKRKTILLAIFRMI